MEDELEDRYQDLLRQKSDQDRSALSQVIKINEALISSLVGNHDQKLSHIVESIEKFELMLSRLFDRIDNLETIARQHNSEMVRIDELQSDIDLLLHEIIAVQRAGGSLMRTEKSVDENTESEETTTYDNREDS